MTLASLGGGSGPQANAARRATAAGGAVLVSGPDLEEASPERSVESTAGGAVPSRQQAREEALLRHGSRRAREDHPSERSAEDLSEQEQEQEQEQAAPGGAGATADSLKPELAQEQETPSSSGAGKPTVTRCGRIARPPDRLSFWWFGLKGRGKCSVCKCLLIARRVSFRLLA